MKLFYRNIVAIGVFLTVMLMIVGTAAADGPITSTPISENGKSSIPESMFNIGENLNSIVNASEVDGDNLTYTASDLPSV